MLMPVLLLAAQQGSLVVGAGGSHGTLEEAIAAASGGDTIVVTSGVYEEHVVIDKSLVVLGSGEPIVDGGGRGIVITVHEPVTIRGLHVRGSGSNQSREDAGIMVDEADSVVIEDNTFSDVLFGVYLKNSHGSIVRGNDVTGKNLDLGRRGDGIRFWYSNSGVIEDNHLNTVRDLVIWFSDSVLVRGNTVVAGRYGLHYMYSDHNRFEGNEFSGNAVGAFLMYSTDLNFRGNIFAAARGASGMGLGLKDSDDIVAVDNVFVSNAIGIFVDNTPTSTGSTSRFEDNVIAFNDAGVTLLPSVHSNFFENNYFVDNNRPVTVSGGGDALASGWNGNYWSDYAGFDADGDSIGDTPYVYQRLSEDIMTRHAALEIFNLSIAVNAVDLLSQVLPLLKPQPILIDSVPIRAGNVPELGAPEGSGRWKGAGLLLAIASLSVVVLTRTAGRRWR